MPDQNQTDPNITPAPSEPMITPPPEPIADQPTTPPAEENVTPAFMATDSPPPPPIIEEENPTKEEMEKKEDTEEKIAPPSDMPKKKPKGLVAGVVAALLLVAGLGAGVVLVRQQQDIRERAANCSTVPVSSCATINCPSGCKKFTETIGMCSCVVDSTPTLTPTTTRVPTPPTATSTQTSTPTPPTSCVPLGQRCATGEKCCNNGTCTNNICKSSSTPTPSATATPAKESVCDDAIDNDKDGKIDCNDSDCSTSASCGKATVESNCIDKKDNDGDGNIDCEDSDCKKNSSICQTTSAEICTDGIDNDKDKNIDCEDSDCKNLAICKTSCPYKFTGGGTIIAGSCTGTCTSGQWAYSYCKGKDVDVSKGCQDDMKNMVRTNPPSFPDKFCGVVQIDCWGSYQTAFQSRRDSSGCGGDGKPEDQYCQCLNVVAYDTSWNALSADQLKQLKAGDKIRFAVKGTASSGQFDKAKFKINGQETAEMTTTKPNTKEFFYEYTIPTNVYTFKIDAKIHHTEKGWSN
jgi:hypothetical protein